MIATRPPGDRRFAETPVVVEDAGMNETKRLRLTGYTDAGAVEEAFASRIVDVAYIDAVTPREIFVVADVGIDLGDRRDREWVSDVIRSVLESVGQSGIVIEATSD